VRSVRRVMLRVARENNLGYRRVHGELIPSRSPRAPGLCWVPTSRSCARGPAVPGYERSQYDAGFERGRGSPAHDPPSEDVDDGPDVTTAGRWRDVGYPQTTGWAHRRRLLAQQNSMTTL
jgi:hypothetical protein